MDSNISILHIANGYCSSSLYHELFSSLNGKHIEQLVIAPTFNIDERSKKSPYQIEYFKRPNGLINRIFFTKKIRSLQNFIDIKTDVSSYDVIHAHSLFSDGIPAYRLAKKYNLPFVVAIRNTDVHLFLKYFLHYRQLIYEVLNEARQIILISPSYTKKIQNLIPSRFYKSIEYKFRIIPNGINKSWLENQNKKSFKIPDIWNIVFVGNIDNNKNIMRLSKACLSSILKEHNIHLDIIGLKENQNDVITKQLNHIANKSNGLIKLWHRKTASEIREFYKRCSIFAMPSHKETFGLVYVEALSQGLPILYTQNEGFDGFYENGNIGIAVKPTSTKSIANGLLYVINNYSAIQKNISQLDLSKFDWNIISDRYIEIYTSITQHNI